MVREKESRQWNLCKECQEGKQRRVNTKRLRNGWKQPQGPSQQKMAVAPKRHEMGGSDRLIRRSDESSLKEINPGFSLEGLMLKLKRQYSGHLLRRTDSLEKTLMLGTVEGRRRRGRQRMRWLALILNGHEVEQTLGDNEGQGSLDGCSPWGHKESDTAEQPNNNKNK